VIVGPDGVGKTTTARALVASYAGPTAYFHFMPPVFAALPAEPPRDDAPPPVRRGLTGNRVLGWMRLARNSIRCWLGYWTRVRPALRRGCLVVGDRWLYGYIADPDALRFYGPDRAGAAVLRWLPRPDFVANLAAPASVVHSRKQELSMEEIEHALTAWANLSEAHCGVLRSATFAAIERPEVIAGDILAAIRS
jgi:hypothetical protein